MIITLFYLFFHISSGQYVDNISISCHEPRCKKYKDKLTELIKKSTNHKTLVEKFKYFLLNDNIKKFYYDIKTVKNKKSLIIHMEMKPIIKGIEFESFRDLHFTEIKSFLPYKKNDNYNHRLNKQALDTIKKYMKERGFIKSRIVLKEKKTDDGIKLIFKINPGELIRIEKINLTSDDHEHSIYHKRILKLKGDIWHPMKIKIKMDELSTELFDKGFFNSRLEILSFNKDPQKNRISLNIIFNLGEKISFDFYGIHLFTKHELVKKIKTLIKTQLIRFEESNIKTMIDNFYKKEGIYDTKISFRKIKKKYNNNISRHTYYIKIVEGEKVNVQNIIFTGNLKISSKKLLDIYYEKASVLAKRDYFDKDFLNQFVSIIQLFYQERGFIFATVENPRLNFNQNKKSVEVEYHIKEKNKVLVRKINIKNINPKINEKIKSQLTNKEGEIFLVNHLEKDLEKVLKILRKEGYFSAKIVNLNAIDIVSYNEIRTEVKINIHVDTGKKNVLNKVLITGNTKTKDIVINREIYLHKGDVLTQNELEEIRESIRNLGIFSSVKITLIKNKTEQELQYMDILIQLQEKDTITLQLAPGYRTDLGVKLSAEATKKNLMKMNRSVSIKGQVNHRLNNFSNLDAYRRSQQKKTLEYITKFSYTDPYLLGLPVDSNFSVSALKKRYFNFDARILKMSALFSKSFGKHLITSIKYQLEAINQFDGSDARDNGYFLIGGLTPFIAVDLRDNPINVRRGAYFSLACEWVNPSLGSQSRTNFQEENDLEINYIKLTSRNKFYIPIGNFWTMAFSIALGYQRNLADDILYNSSGYSFPRGFIPSIKLFRLHGVDTVRGFANNEVNQLDNGIDISESPVSGQAFFANIKLEPRYHVNDHFMLGPFFDAGNVYIDNFRPNKLHSAAGFSLKYLTPVGSINFDYGMKLKRRVFPNNSREKFGRFHLSIGIF